MLVVHESAAVVELMEQALRTDRRRVLGTTNPLEALEVMSRVAIDLLLVDGADRAAARGLVRDFRSVQPRLRVLVLRAGPVSLGELTATVASELAR